MENLEDMLVGCGKYVIERSIGRGKFGWVYRGIRKKTGEPVAVKLESANHSFKILRHETMVLHYLQTSDSSYVPTLFWFGKTGPYMAMVMTLYDASLYDIVIERGVNPEKRVSVYQSLMDILEFIHSKFVIHRDIKPQNFMYKNGQFFLIDFGMANFYIKDENQHIEMATESSSNIMGTPNYISVHIHRGITPSRRDDLISLGYVFLFLLQGSLPWENLRIESEVGSPSEIDVGHPRNVLRLEMKSLENLQQILSNLPVSDGVYPYFKYVYGLSFAQAPHYSAMKNIF
jgi:hypothetical protein